MDAEDKCSALVKNRLPAPFLTPMALEAIINRPEFHRVVLEEYTEGVYVLVFKLAEEWPCRDHLQDNLLIAKLQALEDYGVTDDMWREIPDTGIME